MYVLLRLSAILKKRTISPSKLDEIKTKLNILKAFAGQKSEETKETVQKAEADL